MLKNLEIRTAIHFFEDGLCTSNIVYPIDIRLKIGDKIEIFSVKGEDRNRPKKGVYEIKRINEPIMMLGDENDVDIMIRTLYAIKI